MELTIGMSIALRSSSVICMRASISTWERRKRMRTCVSEKLDINSITYIDLTADITYFFHLKSGRVFLETQWFQKAINGYTSLNQKITKLRNSSGRDPYNGRGVESYASNCMFAPVRRMVFSTGIEYNVNIVGEKWIIFTCCDFFLVAWLEGFLVSVAVSVATLFMLGLAASTLDFGGSLFFGCRFIVPDSFSRKSRMPEPASRPLWDPWCLFWSFRRRSLGSTLGS